MVPQKLKDRQLQKTTVFQNRNKQGETSVESAKERPTLNMDLGIAVGSVRNSLKMKIKNILFLNEGLIL